MSSMIARVTKSKELSLLTFLGATLVAIWLMPAGVRSAVRVLVACPF